MSTKRQSERTGCFLERRHGRLRLRFRWRGKQVSRATALTDTRENRAALRKIANAVAALIKAGKDPVQYLDDVARPAGTQAVPAPSAAPDGPTVRSYYRRWIVEQTPLVRKALARDYRRHLEGYVLATLGELYLADLKPSDVRALQADLLTRGLSVKTVKNIISGSLRAMIGQATADELVTRAVFAGLKWPEWTPPEPDPFTADERSRIVEWFARARFGFPQRPGSRRRTMLLHPPFHAYLHLLFWSGMRPSEASGLMWGDVDLKVGVVHIRRSRHLYGYNAPKTKTARRTVELFPETVRLLHAIKPLHARPDTPVFTSTTETPIEPKSFSEHFYRAQRALSIRPRGLYCTKDTFVTTALEAGVKIAWLEQQTGVRYETLRKHYGRWMPREAGSELRRFAALDRSLFGSKTAQFAPPEGEPQGANSLSTRLRSASEMRGGGLEPPRVFSPLAPQTSASAISAILAHG